MRAIQPHQLLKPLFSREPLDPVLQISTKDWLRNLLESDYYFTEALFHEFEPAKVIMAIY